MDQVFPEPGPIDDPFEILAADSRPVPGDRPWVMANMVASLDGSYGVEGRSAPLSSPGDRTTFHALRALCDAVLVAAGTAREERYRRPWAVPEAQELRAARGQAPAPRLVVVSASLRIPEDQPFLHGEGPPPLVLHPDAADPTRLPAGLEHRAVGATSVDLPAALRGLAGDGARLVLCEGGPGLLGQLNAADLVDELFLTVSPHLVGGDQVGLLGRSPAHVHPYRLHRMVLEDSTLLLTYRRDRDGSAGPIS